MPILEPYVYPVADNISRSTQGYPQSLSQQ